MEGCLHVCEEVFETRFQHIWDEGFGSLPFAGNIELGVVVRSLFRMGKECVEMSIPADTVGDMSSGFGSNLLD